LSSAVFHNPFYPKNAGAFFVVTAHFTLENTEAILEKVKTVNFYSYFFSGCFFDSLQRDGRGRTDLHP
jgi:hypothetical protein